MSDSTRRHPANLLDLDYLALAHEFSPPIVDVHTHLFGPEAARCYRDVAKAYGITLTYSMTPLDRVDGVRDVLGDAVQFIAVPDWGHADPLHAFGDGFLEQIRAFHSRGTRIVKFWVAPRSRDIGREIGDPTLMNLDSPYRRRAMDLAAELGMMFMTHVADPDTWFQTKYADADQYGTKREQYEPLERLLDIYAQPWIAAHMGGWPEDLEFLDGLLERHDNLHLDTSATKWMVRELSKHDSGRFEAFLRQWKGRILFGSDIVVRDEHLAPQPEDSMPQQASSPEEAVDLYASRYWALRTLFEGTYDGPSPIADPDLEMTDPSTFGPLDSPRLHGHGLPADVLASVYHDAARALLDPYRQDAATADTARA
ncbi:MAG: amidohydrolase [Phycisphaerales bacterium]|nr:amidohydrolase [Phycisphaerales bacterium]